MDNRNAMGAQLGAQAHMMPWEMTQQNFQNTANPYMQMMQMNNPAALMGYGQQGNTAMYNGMLQNNQAAGTGMGSALSGLVASMMKFGGK